MFSEYAQCSEKILNVRLFGVLTEDLEPDVGGGPLVADAVVCLADVGSGLVPVHRLDDQRLGTPRLLAARKEVVLWR